MKGELLWVYEGLTQYYGVMLAARSGLMPPEMFREYLAATAAYLDNRPGRTWRDLLDTAIAAQTLYSSPQEGSSWRRSVDYYDEGLLIWLEADTIIRKQSSDRKSLDDFCHSFFGGENSGPKVIAYTFGDVVASMKEIAAFDWRGFFTEHLESRGPGAPLVGIQNSGWRLVFTDVQNDYAHVNEASGQVLDLQFSLGFQVHGSVGDDSDKILDVIPGSPAAIAGLAPGMRLVAVNGRKWSPEILRNALRRTKNSKDTIDLLAQNGDFYATYQVDYHGGERYPHLEPISGKPDLLSEIAKTKAPAVPAPTTY
jgi:predicted metalloprotease with PDZ domain